MADSLFHYTDVGAVKAILENRELWLTDIRFLNDTQELNDGISYVLEALSSYVSDARLDECYIARAREMLTAVISEHIPYYVDIEPTYVCSFSEASDQLSQWRAYGSYAIEFDREIIADDLHLFDCVYDQAKKKIEVESVVADAIYRVSEEVKEFDSFGPESLSATAILVRVASIIKNSSFHEEKEVRSAVDLLLPSSRLKFRQRGSILIPYLVEKFSFEAIKAVHVGPMPNQDLACTAMQLFVQSIEIQKKNNETKPRHKIEVVKSKIPYRAM